MFRWRLALSVLAVWLIVILSVAAWHYRDSYHHAIDKQRELAQLAEARQKTITGMQSRQREVAELDRKYTRELADAKQTIIQLQRDVTAGKRRLHINATCKRVPGIASASGMADATTASLTADARQNYFRLWEQIETAEKQIEGLQEYIKEQCRRSGFYGVLGENMGCEGLPG